MSKIIIVSKEKEKFEFSPQIIEFARGLELYNPDEEIIFEDIITSEFLRVFKAFYENNQYKLENLKVKDIIKSNSLNTNLNSQKNGSLMEPFFKKASSSKSLTPFVELIQGAELLRAPLFKDLVSCTIATVLYCAGSQDYDIKKYREEWNLPEGDTTFPSVDSKPCIFYKYFVSQLTQNYRQKINSIFNPTEEDSKKNDNKEEETLAEKIQEQFDQGFEYEEEDW